ncbi:hypothetical protein EWM64_g7908 [Hericium alpestre]|uniref:Uncharacterized protein n=1 Tax=Hericium alpestre TaxID=135208 RepID=A0A4Y9ZNA9_9AGAM|nr:hypothetical protein EWM64_g7908 [Hericium alpestre]
MYILIWCALHFNLNGSEVTGINGAVVHWTYGAWDAIRMAKGRLFSNDARIHRQLINSAITPTFRPLARWIRNLTLMFDHGFSARGERDDRLDRVEWGEEEAAPDNWNEDTLNNHITYERFMSAIGEGPQLDI